MKEIKTTFREERTLQGLEGQVGMAGKKEIVEKKFWKQTSFWVWIVLAAVIAILSATILMRWITGAISNILPLKLSWLRIEVLLFFTLIGLWIWPGKHMKKLVWAWIAAAVFIMIERPIITITEGQLSMVSPLIVEGITITGLLFWFVKCWKQVGTVELPSQAVLFRLGKPIYAVGPGLYFQFRPVEKFKEFPTGQYFANYSIEHGLYSKEEGKLASQPLEVDITMYYRFPKVGLLYSSPTREIRPDGSKGNWVEERKDGGQLLLRTATRLPVKDLTKPEAIDQIGEHFKKGIVGAARDVMSRKTSQECKEDKPTIEKEIKDYVLTEEGDPVLECGLPRECLDFEITKVKLPDDTEQAYKKPELARKDAEAASQERLSIARRVRAFKDVGVSPDIAGLLAGAKMEGKPMDIGQLRDLFILRAFQKGGNISFEPPRKEQRSHNQR